MYILKDQSRNDLAQEITDSQYEDLIFYKKWKYKYNPKPPVLTQSTHLSQPTQSPVDTHNTYSGNSNSNAFSLIDTILAAEVIENIVDNSQSNQDYQYENQPSQPIFNGGDTDGGGAQGSWDDSNQQQNNDLSDNFS